MQTHKYTVADIELQTALAHGSILSLEITSEQGEHGVLHLTMEVDEETTARETQSYKDTDISVSIKGKSVLFAGVCKEITLTNQASYKTVHITAYTASEKMDQEPKKKTFQNPTKTLQQVADMVAKSYQATVVLDRDIPISQVLYQNNETDWAFLKRIAAAQGKTVFADSRRISPLIYIGELGFCSFDAGVIEEETGITRDVGEMENARQNGQKALGYMYDTYECRCTIPQVSAGDRIDDVKIVKKSTIKLDKGLLQNELTIAYEEGIHPTMAESAVPAGHRSVLTGTVKNVSQNQVQVQMDTDGGAGDMVWAPYASAISNSFYCMPDIGDTVFLYYENNGNIVCLGSKHVNTGNPDFDKPKENSLTSHDRMIKLGEKKVTLTATRSLNDEGNPNEISIMMDEDTGITIQSGRDITIEAGEYMNFFAGNVSKSDEQYQQGLAMLEERHQSGDEKYQSESGQPGLGDLLLAEATNFGKSFVKSFVDMGKGMIMYDMWAGLLSDEESSVPPEADPVEHGVATLYGYETVVLQVDQSIITMDTNIHISADTFKWLGYNQRDHKPEELPLQDWWETVLDGAQFLLDIAGCIPVFGAVPDLINAGISLMRGNYAEAAMSAIAAIPIAGDAVGAAKVAGKGVKLATKALTKTERILSVLQGLYVSAQAAFALYQMKDQLADLYKRWKEGENIFANPADVSLLLNFAGSGTMAARGIKNIGEGMAGKKITFDGGDAMNGNKNQKTTECGDPINVVTGSFGMSYTDLQLRDVRETFFLKRTYESVYENKGMMLGNRWFLNIESRLRVTEGKVQVQLPDMKLLEFNQTEYGFENSRNQSLLWRLEAVREGYMLYHTQEKKTYAYDKDGNLTRMSDRFGNSILLHYENNQLIRMTTEGGQELTFTYENGKLASVKTGDGRKLAYEYDKDLLTKVVLANGSSICYTYDPDGNIHSITDQNENTYVTNEYDRKGRVVRQKTANGGEYILFYDEKNQKTTFTDTVTGEQTIYGYNHEKNVTSIQYGDGTSEMYDYDAWENCIMEQDRNGNETHREYDIHGNLLRESLPGGLITENEYDVHNRRVHQTDNAGREVTWTYDERGCLVEEAMLLAPGKWNRMYFAYDLAGRIIRETNPNGNVTSYMYETFSEPVRRTGPEGEIIRYAYDRAGRCMREITAKGETKYTYNRTDCLTEITDPDGSTIRFGYDRLGNRTSIVSPNLYEKNQGYVSIKLDGLDNVTKVVTAQGHVYRYYTGPDGRVLKAVHPNAYDSNTDDGAGMFYDYDDTGRRIRIHYPDGGCERYFLDGNGNIMKKVSPQQYDSTTDDGAGYSYDYDEAGRLTRVTDPDGTVLHAYVYDLVGNVIKAIDATGYLMGDIDDTRVGTCYTYNLAGWVMSKREPLYQKEDGETYYRLTTYRYDDMGQVLEEKRFVEAQTLESCQGRTHVLRYAYDKSNRLMEVTDSTGAAIRYAYDETGELIMEQVRISEEAFRETRYVYTPGGKLQKRMVRLTAEATADRQSDWAVTSYTYDANGNVTKVTMPEGGCYYYEYDLDDRLVKERHEEEKGEIHNSISYTYDAVGNLTSMTDADGNKTTYEYDLCDRQTVVMTPNGARTVTQYDRNGNRIRRYTPIQAQLLSQNESQAKYWQYTYDNSNRMTGVITPEGTLLNSFFYEPDGKLSVTKDASGSGVQLTYDLAGRRIHAQTTGRSTQSYQYDALGNLTGLTDGLNNRTEFVLDVWGRITGIMKPDGTTEHYTYDYMGNMLSNTDGEGNTVSFAYDLNGNMITRIDQTGNREYFGYDREKRLISMTDRNGSKTRITYNMYGSMTGRYAESRDGMSGNVTETFGYYPDGKLRYAIAGGMRYDYAYDIMGRVSQKKASGRTLLAHTYDLDGNRTSMTDLTGKRCEYRYNSLGQLEEVTDNGKTMVRYQYNADGTIHRMEAGAGLVTEYTYDADKNVISQKTVMMGVGNIQSLPITGLHDLNKPLILVDNTYTYDGNGNRTTKQTMSGLTKYHYDQTQRLVKIDYPTVSEAYNYDKAGNCTEKLINATVATTYHYDAANRLVSQDILSFRTDNQLNNNGIGSETPLHREYTYDKQGNMLSDGERTYIYDAMNRLTEVTTADGNRQRNIYDAEGLRAEIEENDRLITFLYDGDKVVAETDCDQNTIRYIRGYDLISSDSEKAKTYYHYVSDEMGSITYITDENGNICNRYEYDAFGDFTVKEETVSNRFAYTGEQYDPLTGLYYLRSRFYNPVIGRFIQEDTYYGDGLNLYTYCQNNPVKYVDPSGHEGMCVQKQEAINKLKESGMSDAEAVYEKLRGKCTDAQEVLDLLQGKKKGLLADEDIYDILHLRVSDEVDNYLMNYNSKSGMKKSPAVAGAYNRNTGNTFFAINDATLAESQNRIYHPYLDSRISNLSDEAKCYEKSIGAGTHAECKALNDALIDEYKRSNNLPSDISDADLSKLLMSDYEKLKDMDISHIYIDVQNSKVYKMHLPVVKMHMPRCPHCEFITKGSSIPYGMLEVEYLRKNG